MLSAAVVQTTTPGASSEPPPSPNSRPSCDGWLPKPRHDATTAARGWRLTACVHTSPPTRSNRPRWRESAHSSAGAGCSGASPSTCYKDAFVSAFREPILRCMGPRTAVRRRDMRESVHDALRAAPGSRAGCGCDVRHVGAGAPLPRAPATWDNGVDSALLCPFDFCLVTLTALYDASVKILPERPLGLASISAQGSRMLNKS